jgi:hypothetical protein
MVCFYPLGQFDVQAMGRFLQAQFQTYLGSLHSIARHGSSFTLVPLFTAWLKIRLVPFHCCIDVWFQPLASPGLMLRNGFAAWSVGFPSQSVNSAAKPGAIRPYQCSQPAAKAALQV